ncbi:DUF418 domain-containing protein [Chungangia koreensis]|uniref:DUF418 domain-containing protein n=1 Tax=Chungangia koreensis TaxID=752657 RepID=A0ABV8X621_9LACT
MNLTPTPLQERVIAIDMMRGFALLGIFIANMLLFHTPFYYIDPYSWFTVPADKEAFRWIDIFVQASFYPLFSMLFGYGLAMQHRKTVERGISFTPLAVRRLSVLLLFGMFHAFFVWSGDILITYAITGFALFGLLKLSAKWLTAIAAVLFGIGQAILVGLAFFVSKIPSFDMAYVDITKIESSIAAYANGSWGEIFVQRAGDWFYANQPIILPLMILSTILPFTMIGAAAAKAKLIERTGEKLTFWIVTSIVSFGIGFALKMLPYIGGADLLTVTVQDSIGGPFVAVGYGALIALLCQIPLFRVVLRPVARAGRMSFTTYLMQSIIATLIFYSYGLGLYGKVDVATGTWLAVGIFVIQVIFAELWFMKFKYGPFEWVWRKMTYGKLPTN